MHLIIGLLVSLLLIGVASADHFLLGQVIYVPPPASAYLSAVNLESPSLNSGVNTTIPNGGTATLTWDSPGAVSCTGTNFSTGGSVGIGTVTVSPTSGVNTYSVNCGGTTASATVTVSGTRRDAAAGVGTSGCAGAGTSASPWNYLCIQNAINAAVAGDTVFLRGGDWALNTNTDAVPVTANKAFNLVGAGSGNTTDAYGHINNGSGTPDCPTAGTSITCIYVTGTSFAYGSNPSDKGTIKFGLDAGGGTCNNAISHIQFSADVAIPGGDDESLVNFEYCAGPVTLDDVRFYTADATFPAFQGSISGSVLTVSASPTPTGTICVGEELFIGGVDSGVSIASYGTGTGKAGTYNLSASHATVATTSMNMAGNGETELYTQGASNITVKNSFLAIPLSNGAYSTGQAYESVLSNGITLRNNLFWQGFYNPTSDENILYTGNTVVSTLNTYGGPGFGPAGCHLDPADIIGGCPTTGGLDGTFHATFSNNYQNAGTPGFAMGPGVNDLNTNGGVSDLHYTGNWLTGSNLALDACVWNIFGAEGNCPDNGMIINAAANATTCATSWNGSPFAITNNSIIGTATAQLNAGAKGTTHCWATGDTLPSPHTINLATYGFNAQKNYLQSPSNQYNFNGQTFSPTVVSNYCDNASHSGATTFTQTDATTCATSGFTTSPTVSLTLGNLSGTVVSFAATNFTAQYGAVQWLASTSSTTPTSGDARWSFTPPVQLSGITHGSTVYLWAMDSLNHIGAAAQQAVP